MWRNWDEICWMSVIVSVLQNTWYPNYLVFRKSLEYISFLPSHYFPFLWLFNLTEKWHFFVLALWHAFALNSLQTLLNSLVAINTHNNVSEVLVIILGFRSLNHGFICLFIYFFMACLLLLPFLWAGVGLHISIMVIVCWILLSQSRMKGRKVIKMYCRLFVFCLLFTPLPSWKTRYQGGKVGPLCGD